MILSDSEGYLGRTLQDTHLDHCSSFSLDMDNNQRQFSLISEQSIQLWLHVRHDRLLTSELLNHTFHSIAGWRNVLLTAPFCESCVSDLHWTEIWPFSHHSPLLIWCTTYYLHIIFPLIQNSFSHLVSTAGHSQSFLVRWRCFILYYECYS